MAFQAREELSDGKSLTDTIVKYAERSSLDESKVSELEVLLSMLEMGSKIVQPFLGCMPQQQMQVAYFTPASPAFQAPMSPTTIAFHTPNQQGSAQQQSGGSRGSNAVKRRKNKFANTYNGQKW